MQKLNHSEFFENDRIINVLPRIPQEPFPEHSHDFHELVLVKSGCGIHICDGKATHVSKGSVLYLKDEDVHCFDHMDNLCLTRRFSLYVLANTFIPPNNHDFASLRRCSFTRNHAK